MINGKPGQRIRLDFKDFFLQKGGTDCHFTYLVISDSYATPTAEGDMAEMNTYRMCGQNPRVLITKGSQLKVVLHSDQRLDPTKPQKFDVSVCIMFEQRHVMLFL